MIVVSLLEVVSIGAVIPFLSVVTATQLRGTSDFITPAFDLIGIFLNLAPLQLYTLIFIITAIFAGFSRLYLFRLQSTVSQEIGLDLSVEAFELTLYQPYSTHLSLNSSEVLAGTRKAEGLVYTLIHPVLNIISATIILFALISILIVINPEVTLLTFFAFGLLYSLLIFVIKYRVNLNSETIAIHQIRVTKVVQEGLGAIRDVLIDNTQKVYSKAYKEEYFPFQAAIASNLVVSGSPRFIVEAFGIVLIAGLAYLSSHAEWSGVNAAGSISFLGALALASQRILPLIQQLYNSYIILRGNSTSTQDALSFLDLPRSDSSQSLSDIKIEAKSEICLQGIGFRYSVQNPWVLRHLDLRFQVGSTIGIIGATGSGKSTLLDIMMGLLEPIEGSLLVDETHITGRNVSNWRQNISHVPQAIYLADASILENIALGVPRNEINPLRAMEAAKRAQLAETIETWPNGFNTIVGERGVRLSGGQRQRIGIARALYKKSSVLFLDEATSALDTKTEEEVMRSVGSLGSEITVIIISHRLSTLKDCDMVFELKNGVLEVARGN
jgi:ABC-type bacteriocin/lantibiotic exporter with double-glycine peptidase domain